MINSINSIYVKIDNVCDYLPGLSTVTNLVDLFQKCVTLTLISKKTILNNHYFRTLTHKSPLRCIILLIPLFGNILVGVYDFANRKHSFKHLFLPIVKKDSIALKDASDRLKNDKEIVLAAIQQNSKALYYASDELKADRTILLAAVQEFGEAIGYASDELRRDYDVLLPALKNSGLQS